MKSKKSFYIAAIAAALAGTFGTAAIAQSATQECQHGILFGSIEGTTLKTKDGTHTFNLSTEDASKASYWNAGDYLRVCGNEKITNISFRSTPTVTAVTEQAPAGVAQPAVQEATNASEAAATPAEPAPAPAAK